MHFTGLNFRAVRRNENIFLQFDQTLFTTKKDLNEQKKDCNLSVVVPPYYPIDSRLYSHTCPCCGDLVVFRGQHLESLLKPGFGDVSIPKYFYWNTSGFVHNIQAILGICV